MFVLSFNVFGQAAPGAIFQGANILQLKPNIIMKDSSVRIMTGDTDDPTAVAKDAAQGSLYIRSGTGVLYQKQDSGSSTNWIPLLVGPAGAGTDECVARWNGTGVSVLQDSVFCITDLGVGTGLTDLTVSNLNLAGNTLSSANANGDIIINPNGTGNINLPDLTSSRPLKVDGTNNVTATQIDLASSNDVTGVLPPANGGLGVDASAFAANSLLYKTATNYAAIGPLTDGQIIIGSTGLPPAASTLTATANQTTVTNGAGSITIGTVQDIASTSSPTFAGMTITGLSGYVTASAGVIGDDLGTSNQLAGVNSGGTAPEFKTLSGTTNQISVSNGIGTITLSTPQDINTTSSPTFASLTLTSPLSETNGGTGNSSYATGDILYASAANTLSKLAAGTDGQVLTLASGVPSWAGSAGVQTVGTLDSQTKSANGAVITGTSLVLQTADGTSPGLVSTAAQSFAGLKTFIDGIIDSTLTSGRCLFAGTSGRIIDDSGCTFNTTTDTITTGAIDVTSTSVASLPCPRVTTAQKTTIGSGLGASDDGRCVWDTDLGAKYIWNGSTWELATSVADVAVVPGISGGAAKICSFAFGSATNRNSPCTTGSCTIYADFASCVSSVSFNSTGNYTVNWNSYWTGAETYNCTLSTLSYSGGGCISTNTNGLQTQTTMNVTCVNSLQNASVAINCVGY